MTLEVFVGDALIQLHNIPELQILTHWLLK
jgi:hypothetical protein